MGIFQDALLDSPASDRIETASSIVRKLLRGGNSRSITRAINSWGVPEPAVLRCVQQILNAASDPSTVSFVDAMLTMADSDKPRQLRREPF